VSFGLILVLERDLHLRPVGLDCPVLDLEVEFRDLGDAVSAVSRGELEQ
jgi:hypothetical protein